MGKVARKPPTALVSRSGLWLIGGTLLLSAAVLAWAFQGDAPARPVHKSRPQFAARANGGVTPVGEIVANDGGPRDHGDASGALPGRSAPEGQRRLAGGETPGSPVGRGGATPGGRGAAVEGASPDGSLGRRGRRFRQQDGAGDTGGQ